MEDNKILYTEHIVKKFGGLTAVNDANIYVKKGEILGLIGANGAGKTTLFNVIAGALPPTSGKVVYHGKEIQGLKPYKVCSLGIGRTYQIVQPFTGMTALENVMVGALLRDPSVANAKEEAAEILDFLGLGHRANVMGSDMNLPELKRLEVARALATKPEIILLDEVVAGLNTVEAGKFVELLLKVRESGKTLIVIEHVMKAIMTLSDRIYVLNQGNQIAEGTPEEVRNNPEVIKSYFGEKRYADSK